MKKIIFLVVLLLSSSFVSYYAVSEEGTRDAWRRTPALSKGGGDYDPRSILVKFNPGVNAHGRKALLEGINGKMKDKDGDGKDDRFQHILGGRLALVGLKGDKGKDLSTVALRALSRNPNVEYAEHNYYLYLASMPNDPRVGECWGLNNTGQSGGKPDADIDAAEAWDITVGSPEVVVGVIDTGVDYTHQDLIGNMWVNPGEIPGNGVDDDGNGWVDDVHGINAITGTGNPMDDHFHGTHVSGTIGAVGNNSLGVAGVNHNVKIVGMKFLNAEGSGTLADAVTTINYAVGLRNSGVNLRVLNNSWGGGPSMQSMKDAISAANTAGMLFLAAAGNDSANNDASAFYPCCYDVPNVVGVAATDHNDNLCSFSNYGSTKVDLGAPGAAILSTTLSNSYESYNGTSMATPHVSGAAALLLSVDPGLTVAELKSILMDSGDSLASLNNKCVSGKRLNVANALGQLSVSPPVEFHLLVDKVSQKLSQEQSAQYTINIKGVSGYSDSVTLSATATPSLNAAITFTPVVVTPGSSSVMQVATTTATQTGSYRLTITATGGPPSNPMVKTREVVLTVYPEGMTTVSYSNNTQMWIPDIFGGSAVSTINVPDDLTVWETEVEVNIFHPWVSDLVVKIICPHGGEVILHNHEGGAGQDIHKIYKPTDYVDMNCQGTWTLEVTDDVWFDEGYLTDWTLTIKGSFEAPVDEVPAVAIASPTNGTNFSEGETVNFNGTATDPEDGDLTASLQWSSSVDGNIGTGGQLSLSNLSLGPHTITASVTDSASQSGSAPVQITINNQPVNGTPSVTIASPANGANFNQGDAVNFNGTASDPEDGNLTSSLQWSSSADGNIGTGGQFTLSTLSVGPHTITATVTDSDGKSGSASVQINITQNASPIVLTVSPLKEQGNDYAFLSWTGSTALTVDIYRDGEFLTSTLNFEFFTDSLGKGKRGKTVVYRVCEGGVCSNNAPVRF